MTYTDEANGIQAELKFGSVKKKPKDYFSGVVRQKTFNDKWVDLTTFKGTYLGYIEFDGVRYWDLRETKVQVVEGVPFESTKEVVLQSDSRLRKDSTRLRDGDIDDA